MTILNQVDLPKGYFSIQKFIFKCLGLSLTQNWNVIYKAYSICLLTLLVLFPFLVFWDLFTGRLDFNDFLKNAFYGVGVSVAVTKQIIILRKRSQLKKIMDTFEHGEYLSDFKYRETAETIRIKNCVNFTRKIIFVGTIMVLNTHVFAVLATLITNKNKDDRPLPFGTMSLLTENISYEIVFACQSVVMIFAATIYVIVDIVFGSLILHICTQLSILQNFIHKMDRISYTTITRKKYSTVPWKHLQQMVKNAVLYHIAIIKISKETEEVFNVQVLTETVGMSFSFCFLLYRASKLPVTDFYFQHDLASLVSGYSTIFLMSYLGNEIIIRSQAIADACYEVNFIGSDIRFQKALMLIIQRSQRPITFTVGKFATLSLVTAVLCCRACYSCYMLLHQVNEK